VRLLNLLVTVVLVLISSLHVSADLKFKGKKEEARQRIQTEQRKKRKENRKERLKHDVVNHFNIIALNNNYSFPPFVLSSFHHFLFDPGLLAALVIPKGVAKIYKA
jgi:hypothetical protein